MRLIFVHGWSITNTNTYGELPQSISSAAAGVGLEIQIDHIYLGKYISFHDEVTMDDIARAFNYALKELPGSDGPHSQDEIAPFSCITHSTGGPVVRAWVDKYYGVAAGADIRVGGGGGGGGDSNGNESDRLTQLPLKHLVMLAPANHGSSLATLGKQRVGRIKAWFSGVEPGQRVLDWLCLGSKGQWQLNEQALNYSYPQHEFYPFVLTGQGIDSGFYDFLNGYLVESGSDGVIRVAGANMNYRYLSLTQTQERFTKVKGKVYRLAPAEQAVRKPVSVPMGVFSQFSHSGTKMGIMANKATSPDHGVVVKEVLNCLKVDSTTDYEQRHQALAQLTQAEQAKVPEGKSSVISHYAMLVIRVRDELGELVEHQDYDILLLAGTGYKPNRLPEGFFVDRQMNTVSHTLVYYLDAAKMSQIKDHCFGIQVNARPDKGFSYFHAGQFRSEGLAIDEVFAPNQTTYVDITLKRQVDKNVFRFSRADKPRENFTKTRPSGDEISE